MKIADGIYQISGHPYGFNSNIYAVNTDKGIILIDAGFSKRQYEECSIALKKWGLNSDNVIALFITHAHFDHIGNAYIYEQRGIPVYIGEKDAQTAECGGDTVLEELFEDKFHVCRHVIGVKDKEIFDFGNAVVEVWDAPGHTKGNVSYLIRKGDITIIFVGDMLVNGGTTPKDELLAELGWNGSPDFSKKDNIKSLERMRNLSADIVAPGHGSIYYGDSRSLFETVYRKAFEEGVVQITPVAEKNKKND